MEQPITKEEMIETGAIAQGPIPGQALTESADSRNDWETPPEIVDLDEGISNIFMYLTESENLPSVLTLMDNSVPVSVIAGTILTQGFKEGKWLPQLMALLLEPVMYILIALAEKAGIDPVVYEDEDDMADSIPEEKDEIEEEIESLSFQDLRPKNLKGESLPPKVQAELENIEPEQLQSLLARSPQQEPSLLAAGE
jgi:hypothetical protein